MCGVLQKTGYDAMHVELLPKGDESSDRDITMYADDHGLINRIPRRSASGSEKNCHSELVSESK